jgi:hypothetical protein
MENQELLNIIKLAWPLLLLQIGLQIYAIYDILKNKNTKHFQYGIWLVIVILGEIVGPIIYFVVGKSEDR